MTPQSPPPTVAHPVDRPGSPWLGSRLGGQRPVSGEASAIDWVVGSSELVGAVAGWCRVRTSLATHRALLVRLAGRSDIKLGTLVAGPRHSHSVVYGSMDRLPDHDVLGLAH